MKINRALIYVLINLLFVQFCAADEKEAELSIPEVKIRTHDEEDEKKLEELGESLDDDKKIEEYQKIADEDEKKLEELGESLDDDKKIAEYEPISEEGTEAEPRQLKSKRSRNNKSKSLRRRKAAKKAKKPKRSKKTKKSRSKKRKNKKRKSLRSSPAVEPEPEPEPETPTPATDPEPETTTEESKESVLEDSETSILPELKEEEDLEKVVENKLDKTKRYWDSDILEPEHVINEWLAISDGKKYDPQTDVKFPFLTDDENDYDRYYISKKLKKRDSPLNKYKSGSKFKSDEGLSTNYVIPIIIEDELLRATNPDTKEDELENMIINGKFKQNYRGRVVNQNSESDELETGDENYDLQEYPGSYSSESMGSYSKADTDGIINSYGESISTNEETTDYENNLSVDEYGDGVGPGGKTDSDMSDMVSGQEEQVNAPDSMNEEGETAKDSEWEFGNMDLFDETGESGENVDNLSKKDCKKELKNLKKKYETKLKKIKKLASR